MICPHCKKNVSDTNDERAWDMAGTLDPNDPGSIALDGDTLAARAGFYRSQLETVKRHYRDHVLPQTGLALAYDHSTDRYWLTPMWLDTVNPDVRTWSGGMLNRIYHECRHARDALEIAYKDIPTSKRKQRLLVRTLFVALRGIVDQVEIALENAALAGQP